MHPPSPEYLDPKTTDHSVTADVLLRQAPPNEEEEDEDDDKKDEDDGETDDGYKRCNPNADAFVMRGRQHEQAR
jgi:hypothetical protein